MKQIEATPGCFCNVAVFKVSLYRLCLIETIDCILRCSRMCFSFLLEFRHRKNCLQSWEFEGIVIITSLFSLSRNKKEVVGCVFLFLRSQCMSPKGRLFFMLLSLSLATFHCFPRQPH